MLQKLLLITLFPVALSGATQVYQYGDDATPYPLYAIEFGLDYPIDEEHAQLLAGHFDAYFGSIEVSPEAADRLRELRPGFQILNYVGNWRVGREAYEKVENGQRADALHYWIGNLAHAIGPEDEVIELTATYGEPGLLESADRPEIWLRVGEEWMRVVEADGWTIRVERGWDGTEATSHHIEKPVLAPALSTGDGMRYGRLTLRHDTGARLRWEEVLDFLLERHAENSSGIWIDILVNNFATYTLDGQLLRLASGRQWDMRNDRPYSYRDLGYETEKAVAWMQNRFYEERGEWPVIWSNNMEFPVSKDSPRLQPLIASEVQPRPVDGLAMENMYAHWGYGGGSGKEFLWVPYEEWKVHLECLMRMGEWKLNATPLMFDGGIDNLKFARLTESERVRLIEYGYASYLLGVKVYEDGTIYTPLGSTPTFCENPDAPIDEQDFAMTIYDCLTWDIGRPAETRDASDHLGYKLPGRDVFARRFENGIVLVNPTASEQTDVSLSAFGDGFRDPHSGQAGVTSMTLGPRSGRILLAE